MNKPFNHRLLHSALLVIELALVWVLFWLMWTGPTNNTGIAAVGALAVMFIFAAHVTALSLQYIVSRFPANRHTFAVVVCVLGSILLALALAYAMLMSVIALNPSF